MTARQRSLARGHGVRWEKVMNLYGKMPNKEIARTLGLSRSTVNNYVWEAKHPERRVAHKRVESALRSGRLVKSRCEECGDTEVQAHHEDYSRPLDVRWLCYPCHREEHKNG